jgi:chloramphenicol 3-O-phosphotransferase
MLILNGASGTGKSTTAEALAPRISGALWIHPDGLWDTPNLKVELILRQSAEVMLREHGSAASIVDCQIRPSAISAVLMPLGIQSWVNVLHTCPRAIREQRLLQRGWDLDALPTIETWANILHAEALDAGDLVVDTSLASTDAICDEILNHLSQSGIV